jgi:hypothetical protein
MTVTYKHVKKEENILQDVRERATASTRENNHETLIDFFSYLLGDRLCDLGQL